MKTLIRLFLLVAAFVALLFPVYADSYKTFTTAAHTPLVLQTGRAQVRSVMVLNATAGALNLKLYDAANTTTNYTQAAYNSILVYQTNYNVITTNLSGVLLTNIVRGSFRETVPVSSATVIKPRVLDITIPANSIRTYELEIQPGQGLVAHANGIVDVELAYP